MTSGRAACTAEWIANAAVFTIASPSTTSPLASTRMRSDWRMWLKLIPSGFTQKWSRCSGSRAVMCPATPSSNPNLPNSRNPAARRSLRCSRSSSTLANVGRYQRSSSAMANPFFVPAYSRPERGQALELLDRAVVVHEQPGGPGTDDDLRCVGGAGLERSLREHLRAPCLTRDDRDRRETAVRRLASTRIDQMVKRVPV